MRSVFHSTFFSTQFTSLHFLVKSCNITLLSPRVTVLFSRSSPRFFCLPGPRDQRQLGTSVLSRSSPSILLLALCTARAIRVTVRLMEFTRIHFCVRVVLM